MEVFDLKDSSSVCGAIPDVEVSSLFATGNTFNGKAVFCGGYQTQEDCYVFNPENQSWESFTKLLHQRCHHTSVQLTEDSFWILGNNVYFPTAMACIKNTTFLYRGRGIRLFIGIL